MTVFLENPIPIVVAGIVLEAILAVVLVRTGRGVILWAMVGVLAVALGGITLEQMVVTEKERVEQTLEAVVAAVKANDREAVIRQIDPNDANTINLIDSTMRRVEFTDAKITGLDITINRLTSPPTAHAHVIGYVGFEERSGLVQFGRRLINLDVVLGKQADRWVILEHKLKDDPRGG